MLEAMNSPAGMLLAGSIVLLSGAGILLFFSRERSGSRPYCGVCEYSLEKLTSSRCPECGSIVKEYQTLGRCVRSPTKTVVGIFFCLSGLCLCLSSLSRLDYYQLKPNAWLIHDLRIDGRADRAWHQIQKRFPSSSKCERAALIAGLITAIENGSQRRREYRGLLAGALVKGELTKSQEEQFCRGLFGLSLKPIGSSSIQFVEAELQMSNPLPVAAGEQPHGFMAIVNSLRLSVPGAQTLQLLSQGGGIQLGDAEVSRWTHVQPIASGVERLVLQADVRIILRTENSCDREYFRGTVATELKVRRSE